MGEDLVAFLRDRLDEEEAAARDLLKPYAWGYSVFYEASPEELAHIERYRPARVLADVQAKRAIIARFERACYQADNDDEDFRDTWDEIATTLEETLLQLATVYATHPDYEEAWRIDVSTAAAREHDR